MIVCGIDTGTGGAIAFLDADTNELLDVVDMPVHRIQVGKYVRSRVARADLLAILNRARGSPVFVERPEARPRRTTDHATGKTIMVQPGAAGMFSMGESYGCVVMGCAAAMMSLTEVSAGKWKGEIGVPAAKDDARRRAQSLWPADAHRFERVKDDGRAEAALVAYYGVRQIKGGRLVDVA